MPMTRSGGIDIHYEVAGDGPETILLVNGVGDDLQAWPNQLPDLLAAGLRIVTLDNRGVGRSGQPAGPYASREMAADIKPVVDALGLAPFHIAGVSMGGCIALEYALANPADLRSAIFANTYARPDPFTYAAFEAWGLIAEAAGTSVLMRQMAPWIFSPSFYEAQPANVAALVAEMERSPQPPASFAAQIGALLSHDCLDRLADIDVRSLVLVADDDIIIRPELSRRLFDGLPDAEWAVVPGGHGAFWENPGPWNRAVIDFIGRQSAGGDPGAVSKSIHQEEGPR
jgi:pimeloyl-ACP methyl ester carboxylesterase